MAQLVPIDHDPFDDLVQPSGGAFGVFSPGELAEQPRTDVIGNMVSGMAHIPERAFQSSEAMRGGYGYEPGPILEAAALPMGTGAMAGVPVKAGEHVLGAGAIRSMMNRYDQALAEGKITPAEHESFKDALWNGNGIFPDKTSGRTELNLTTRLIDKYAKKQQAWQDGSGPALTKAERAEWQAAFMRKQAAQQYLVTTQPNNYALSERIKPVDHDPFGPLVPVDHDPFAEHL
jgi:hypothetical protein